MRTSHDWLSHQLSEFLAAVSAYPNEAAAIEGGAERLAEAVEAEVVAVVIDECIVTCLGFAPGEEPVGLLLGMTSETGRTLVPGIGEVALLVIPLDDDPGRRIVLGRAEASFSSEEVVVLRGMVRTLGLTLRLLRMLEGERRARHASELQTEENSHLVASLQERHELLERLFRIQKSISHRAPLATVFEAITEGAATLLDAEVVALRLLDPDDADYLQIVSSIGVNDETIASIARSLVGQGVGGRAVSEERMVIADDYQAWPHRMRDFDANQLQTAIAAPVYRDGEVAGSLTVATYDVARRFTGTEQEMLLAFAQHTSLALNDASALLAIQRAFDDAMHRATHDELTGLPNRALVLDRLSQALASASRADTPLCVLFVDLDRFKAINDSLGHSVGDEVLVQVAQRLRSAVRPSDTVGRLSGDEFVVICERSTLDETLHIAERVARSLGQSVTLYGRDVTLTASVGVAVATEKATGEDILRDADVAMYRAKERGRARIEVFDETIRAQMVLRIEMEQELRRAIAAGDLRLHYQPIVDGRTGELTGLEALVRWQHPYLGLLGPDSFIPLAEDAGLIIPLGRWVVEEACRQAARWRRERSPLEDVCISVNLSARQFADIGLLDMVVRALDEAGLPGSALGFEITESVLMEEADAAVDALRQLKDLGCHLAIDDFGTGYSSLSYLQSFPVDTVKIDRSFVSRLEAHGGSGVIVAAVVGLARALGLGVVAEGVETEDQLALLHRLGCDTIQGYLFSRPRTPDELETAWARTATGVAAG